MIELTLSMALQDIGHALLRQTALLTLVSSALLMLRRPLSHLGGPGLAYAAWAALPLLLVVALLPASTPATRFTAELFPGVLPDLLPNLTRLAPALAEPAHPVPLSSIAGVMLGLCVWALGAITVAWRMVRLQRRFEAALTRDASGRHWIGAQGPALVGLWPARLVLPPDFAERFDARQRPLVLAHEEVHRRRGDNHWNALASALCALHWFNPLAWLALRAMRADQELSCDHAVMRLHPGQQADYGRALLRAQQAHGAHGRSHGDVLALLQPWSGWRSSHPLIERITMLAVRPHSRSRRLLGAGALAVLTLGAAGAVHAVNAVMPDLARDPVALDLAIDVSRIEPGVATDKRTSKMRLVAEEGQQALVVLGGRPDQPTPDQIRIEITPKRRDGKHVMLNVLATEGGRPLLRSAVLVEDGKEATLFTAPDGDKRTELLIRVRTIGLGEVPGYKAAR